MRLSNRYFIPTISAIAGLLLILLACNNSQTKAEPTSEAQHLVFDKLAGTWQNVNGKGFERWTKQNDGTYRSVVFSLSGEDTSWNEQANIFPENNNWVFENTVKDQNGGKTVRFASSILTEKTVQFSNPDHDFPTDINYTIQDSNTLKAFIVGPNQKGGKDTIPFNYIRIN